jgi:hypothetical protein
MRHRERRGWHLALPVPLAHLQLQALHQGQIQ